MFRKKNKQERVVGYRAEELLRYFKVMNELRKDALLTEEEEEAVIAAMDIFEYVAGALITGKKLPIYGYLK